jgi:hypothetical protein
MSMPTGGAPSGVTMTPEQKMEDFAAKQEARDLRKMEISDRTNNSQQCSHMFVSSKTTETEGVKQLCSAIEQAARKN